MTSTVEVLRGRFLESRHRVHAAVAAADGALVAHTGDPELATFWRSAAKFFQAVPAITLGAADALRLSSPELALACSSHNGEPRHVAIARMLLERSGSRESDLCCGAHASLNEEVARAQVANGATLTRLHSNCSGKHAAMLALAAHRGWPKAGYELPEHPVQRACHAEVAAWSGADPLPWATDGCGVPTFILPLARMAQAYARLAVVAEGGAVPGGGPSDDSQRAAARLVAAVAADPFLIAGTGRLDTDLIVATNGRIVAKVGADGVYCVALRDAGLGVALKVEDGAVRALAPALLALLDVLAPGAAPAAELESWRRRLVLNSNGLTVGEIRGRVELVNGAPKG